MRSRGAPRLRRRRPRRHRTAKPHRHQHQQHRHRASTSARTGPPPPEYASQEHSTCSPLSHGERLACRPAESARRLRPALRPGPSASILHSEREGPGRHPIASVVVPWLGHGGKESRRGRTGRSPVSVSRTSSQHGGANPSSRECRIASASRAVPRPREVTLGSTQIRERCATRGSRECERERVRWGSDRREPDDRLPEGRTDVVGDLGEDLCAVSRCDHAGPQLDARLDVLGGSGPYRGGHAGSIAAWRGSVLRGQHGPVEGGLLGRAGDREVVEVGVTHRAEGPIPAKRGGGTTPRAEGLPGPIRSRTNCTTRPRSARRRTGCRRALRPALGAPDQLVGLGRPRGGHRRI